MATFSPEPLVRLTNAFAEPFNNAVATARTCYSSRIVTAADVDRDDTTRAQRDRIARSTYEAGHHTTLQHATFQFSLECVSRQFIWSFLHSHPFYNSEQVSQRYVEVKPGNVGVPPLESESARALYLATCTRQMEAYQRLIELLLPDVRREYFRIFPARAKHEARWASGLKKRAMEIARYVLPVATHAHLYHTISGLTLHRYHRLCDSFDCPTETRAVVAAMLAEVHRHDPLFFREIQDPIPLEETAEYRFFADRALAPGADAAAFVDDFDHGLGGYRSKLVDYKVNAEESLAASVRTVLGVTRERLSDDAAIHLALSPRQNPLLGEALTLTTLSKVSRALSHPHYTFRKKISHTADSQDQRHRMVPGSRPVLAAHYVPGRPDAILPELVAQNGAARALYDEMLAETWRAIDALRDEGVPAEHALYLLPNAFPIRFEESGDLTHLHHKWTQRLCFLAQEEIWRCSLEEVLQVRDKHPRIAEFLLPPCGLRAEAGIRPACPEGDRFCGIPAWKLDLEEYFRLL